MLFSLRNKPISKASRLFSLTIKDERLLLWRQPEYVSSEQGSYKLPHRLLEQYTLRFGLSFLLSPSEWLETFSGWWKSMQRESRMQTLQYRRSCERNRCSFLFQSCGDQRKTKDRKISTKRYETKLEMLVSWINDSCKSLSRTELS